MNSKKMLFSIILLILSVSIVSAETVNDTSDNLVIPHNNTVIINQEQDNLLNENTSQIYVGKNSTADGGNGSKENPYNSLDLVSDTIQNEDKIEINIFNGTYHLNSDLKFNTSNLIITGIGGEVIIKNMNNITGSSIGLTSSKANCTFSNLIFDGENIKSNFYPFKGTANLAQFNNCTFINFINTGLFNSKFNKRFNSCNFINSTNSYFISTELNTNSLTELNYCILSSNIGNFANGIYLNSNISLNGVWFGQNIIPNYIYPHATTVWQSENYLAYVWGYSVPVTKYAIFSAHENFLGNHTFEIIGKLLWNDSTSEDIDKLNPMSVILSSSTGFLSDNIAILKNGSFKVTYKSNSSNNKVKIILDSEVINLNFHDNIQVSSNPVYYGENQNITINLPQDSKGVVNVIVDNKTYVVNVTNSLFNFTIPDQLAAGIHHVNLTFIDKENHYYGSSNLHLQVLKNDFELLVGTPAETSITDENITITVLLPNDAKGTLNITVKDKNLTLNVNGANHKIIISSLLDTGNNNLLITYSNDVKYSNQTKSIVLTVNKLNPHMNIFVFNSSISNCLLNISLPVEAKGEISIFSNNKNMTKNIDELKDYINISSIVSAGNNNIKVVYSGDENYSNQIKSLKINIEKINPLMNISIDKNIVNVGERFIINLTFSNKISGNISVKIAGKLYLFKVGDIIEVCSTILGLNVINVTYEGNEIYSVKSVLLNIMVEKKIVSNQISGTKQVSKIPSKFIAKNKTFKSKTKTKKYSVFLKAKNGKAIKKVKITLKIKGKTYKATTNSKGKVIFKIKKLTKKGKYIATVKFKGNAIYKSCSKKVKILIKK